MQYVDVIGQVADNRNPFIMHQQVIHSVPLQFIGKSDPTLTKRQALFNPGTYTSDICMRNETYCQEYHMVKQTAVLMSNLGKIGRKYFLFF